MSDIKFPKNYRRAGSHRNHAVDIGGKVITLVPCEQQVENSDSIYSFVGWRPVKNAKRADGTTEQVVQVSGTLTDKFSQGMLEDYLTRSVDFGSLGSVEKWDEHFPVAKRGDRKGLERELPIHRAVVSGEFHSAERTWEVKATVAIAEESDGLHKLSVVMTPQGKSAGRTASAPVESDDDF